MIYLYCGTHTKGVCRVASWIKMKAMRRNQTKKALIYGFKILKVSNTLLMGLTMFTSMKTLSITPQIRALLPNMRKMMLVHFLFHSCKYLGNYIFK